MLTISKQLKTQFRVFSLVVAIIGSLCGFDSKLLHAQLNIAPGSLIYTKTMEFDEFGRIQRKVLSSGNYSIYEWSDEAFQLALPGKGTEAILNLPAGVRILNYDSQGKLTSWTFYQQNRGESEFSRPDTSFDALAQILYEYQYDANGQMQQMLKVEISNRQYSRYERQAGEIFKLSAYQGLYDFHAGPQEENKIEERLFRKVIQEGKIFEEVIQRTVLKPSSVIGA